MSRNNNTDELAKVRTRLERFHVSNTELSQQLSDALKRSQRLASSLGFRDIYEAQATIDTADSDLSYRECFEEVETLRAKVGELEEQLRQPRPSEIFEELHPHNSIPSEIAIDALPAALRLAYCEVSGKPRQCNVDEVPAEGSIRMCELTDQGLETLQRNAMLVEEWENMFSFMDKDRTSKVSQLTKRESFIFQRALYRTMLVCWLYGMGSIPESDMQDENYPYTYLEKYQARQKSFLIKYPTDDLFEINFVSRFVVYIACIFMPAIYPSIASVRYVYDWRGLYLFGGPTFIMDQYRNRERGVKENSPPEDLFSYISDDGAYTDFLTYGLDEIVKTRTGFMDPHPMKRILDSVKGGNDPCARCNYGDKLGLGFSNLKNESSWDDMKFTDILGDLYDEISHIRLKMGIKYPETKYVNAEIRRTPSRQLMEEIFELRRGEYVLWKREDWVCRDCWIELIADTMSTWWAERRPEKMSEVV